MKIARRKRKKPVLELTPLVDVVFLLLTFYMLTSTFIGDEGVPLELPQSNSSIASENDTVSVSLLDGGEVQVEKEKITVGELQSYLRGRLKADTTVIVRSGRGHHVQSLISVLDEIRGAGGSSVTLATERTE